MKNPDIRIIEERKLAGMKITTSLSEAKTLPLWQNFMKQQFEIPGKINNGFFSVQIYASLESLMNFTPDTKFEKWAAVEVESDKEINTEMESLTIPKGKYAVFIHKGPASLFHKTTSYIFRTWLPNSGHQLDDRPHFEWMADKYKGPEHPDSEEEVWIPIQ